MGWIITTVALTLITVLLLKDLHVREYRVTGLQVSYPFVREYNFKCPVWLLIVIILLYLVPVFNILLFCAFLICLIYWSSQPDENKFYYCRVLRCFSLRYSNWLTRSLRAIGRLFCRPV